VASLQRCTRPTLRQTHVTHAPRCTRTTPPQSVPTDSRATSQGSCQTPVDPPDLGGMGRTHPHSCAPPPLCPLLAATREARCAPPPPPPSDHPHLKKNRRRGGEGCARQTPTTEVSRAQEGWLRSGTPPLAGGVLQASCQGGVGPTQVWKARSLLLSPLARSLLCCSRTTVSARLTPPEPLGATRDPHCCFGATPASLPPSLSLPDVSLGVGFTQHRVLFPHHVGSLDTTGASGSLSRPSLLLSRNTSLSPPLPEPPRRPPGRCSRTTPCVASAPRRLA